jgi:hypothetical protein
VYDVLSVVEGPGGSRETLTTETFDEPIWAVKISRLITPSQRLALSASQGFTDVAAGFRLGFDQPVPIAAPTGSATGAPYKQLGYGLDWRFQAARTTINVSLGELRERYVLNSATMLSSATALNPPTDVNITLANASLARQLSPVLTWDIAVSWQRTEQVGMLSANGTPASTVSGQSSNLVGALTALRWQVGERLALRFVYAYSRQSGAYTDNQIGVIASWALIGAQALTTQPGLSPVSPASTRSP